MNHAAPIGCVRDSDTAIGDEKGFFHCRSGLPTEERKEPDGGLFDELVFGVVIGIQRACLRPQRWGLCVV